MKAIILAAGYATRLYPLTKECAKPLLHVGKRPIIDHIIDKITALSRVDEVIIVTNEKFYRQFQNWADDISVSVPLTVLNDHTTSNVDRKGAIGDIQYCIEQCAIDDDILVIGGDNLFSFSLEALYQTFNRNRQPTVALYDVGDLELVKKYSVVSSDREGKVKTFIEKPNNPDSTSVSICIYMYPNSFLEEIGTYLQEDNPKDAPGNLVAYLVDRGNPVYSTSYEGAWFDIGSFESLEEARQFFSEEGKHI